MEALLVTGDRDSFQLAGENTSILYTKRGISETQRVTPAWVRETYGVTPAQLIDVKGLMGDASDNIPGVPGVGEKTALRLIAQYGDLCASAFWKTPIWRASAARWPPSAATRPWPSIWTHGA